MRWWCVERAGEMSRTAASNSKFGVLNIAGAAVIPFIKDGTQAVFEIDINDAITA